VCAGGYSAEAVRKMIKGVFVINSNGKARLIKCFERLVRLGRRRRVSLDQRTMHVWA